MKKSLVKLYEKLGDLRIKIPRVIYAKKQLKIKKKFTTINL